MPGDIYTFAALPATDAVEVRCAARALASVAGGDVEALRAALLALGAIEAPTPERVAEVHGTYAAYSRHRRTDKRPCDACRAADVEYKRQRAQRACGAS